MFFNVLIRDFCPPLTFFASFFTSVSFCWLIIKNCSQLLKQEWLCAMHFVDFMSFFKDLCEFYVNLWETVQLVQLLLFQQL